SAVTGPPGTGKSEVVAVVLLNQLLRKRPTPFARKNHQALGTGGPRLNGAVEGGELFCQTARPELSQRQNYLSQLQALLTRPSRPDTTQGEVFQRRFHEVFTRQREGLTEMQALEQVREEYGRLNQQLDKVRKQLPLAVQSDESLANWPSE